MAKNWTHYATLNSPIIKCWYDALALIMQTGYEVSSLSVPVISRINDWAVRYKNHLVLLVIDYTFKE